MNGLAVLIPVAIGLGLVGLMAFFWALSNNQFEDPEGAAARILLDDEDDIVDESDSVGDTKE